MGHRPEGSSCRRPRAMVGGSRVGPQAGGDSACLSLGPPKYRQVSGRHSQCPGSESVSRTGLRRLWARRVRWRIGRWRIGRRRIGRRRIRGRGSRRVGRRRCGRPRIGCRRRGRGRRRGRRADRATRRAGGGSHAGRRAATATATTTAGTAAAAVPAVARGDATVAAGAARVGSTGSSGDRGVIGLAGQCARHRQTGCRVGHAGRGLSRELWGEGLGRSGLLGGHGAAGEGDRADADDQGDDHGCSQADPGAATHPAGRVGIDRWLRTGRRRCRRGDDCRRQGGCGNGHLRLRSGSGGTQRATGGLGGDRSGRWPDGGSSGRRAFETERATGQAATGDLVPAVGAGRARAVRADPEFTGPGRPKPIAVQPTALAERASIIHPVGPSP